MDNNGVGSWLHRRRIKSGTKTAVISGGKTLSYADLADRTDRLAHALKDRGVAKGDRVAYLARITHLLWRRSSPADCWARSSSRSTPGWRPLSCSFNCRTQRAAHGQFSIFGGCRRRILPRHRGNPPSCGRVRRRY